MTETRTVHVVFKTHLDLGFTDYARQVEQQYFTQFFPAALATAAELRGRGGPERFVWTTGSWLVYEYLERATTAQRTELEAAIAAGDLVWHALPFTLHSELMDESLFLFGLSLAEELDRRFGRRTIAAKMTDVPGHTRGIVPLLASAGVELLHIGVNAASRPPDLPLVFRWREPGGAELTVMYQRGGYGDLAVVPGLASALAFGHTNDNHGPQAASEVLGQFAALRSRFPEALVVASTLDAFAAELRAIRERLPVVTQEIGDTWIHGVGSDPAKVARFRELSRLRREWLEQRGIAAPALRGFGRKLLLVPEHTWGLDEKTHLDDAVAYAPAQLRRALAGERFSAFAASWAEQRAYLDAAVGELPAELAPEARARIAALAPAPPDLACYEPVAYQHGEPLELGALAAAAGAQLRLPGPLVVSLGYQSFGEADYERFYRRYNVNRRQTSAWSRPDFTKPGIDAAGAVAGWWRPEVRGVYRREGATARHTLVVLAAPQGEATRLGCPQEFTLELAIPHAAGPAELTAQWFGKQANRLPEAIWLSLSPAWASMRRWQIQKLGQWVAPRDVVRDGNRRLHAAHAIRHADGQGELRVDLLDAALVAPGEPSLLRFTNRLPAGEAMHVNLYNNVWGTNFPMWYGEDARFRFVLQFTQAPRL